MTAFRHSINEAISAICKNNCSANIWRISLRHWLISPGIATSAKQRHIPCSGPPPVDQDLSTCRDWPVKKPLSIYQSGLTANPKRMSGNSSTPLGAQNKDIGAASSSLKKVLSVQRQTLKTVRRYSYGFSRQCPVSVVVAEIAMQNIEEQAPAIFSRTIRLWLRYVDAHSPYCTQRLNRRFSRTAWQTERGQFTMEIGDGKIPFLDCLVSRDNNRLRTTIYKKPTHTDRLLNQSSYNPTSHKATTIECFHSHGQHLCKFIGTKERVCIKKELNSQRTGLGHKHGRRFIVLGHKYGCRDVTWKHSIRTLTRLAQLVCNSPDSLQDETDYLNNVFSKNNYSRDFVRRNTHSKTDSDTQTNVNSGPVTTATIPYIRGTSETIARILQHTCCTQTDNHFTATAY